MIALYQKYLRVTGAASRAAGLPETITPSSAGDSRGCLISFLRVFDAGYQTMKKLELPKNLPALPWTQ